MKNVVVVIGAGQIGQAIARRVGFGKHVLLADMRRDNANRVFASGGRIYGGGKWYDRGVFVGKRRPQRCWRTPDTR